MAKLPLCPHCSKVVEKNDPSKKIKSGTYHLTCYSKAMSQKYEKEKSKDEPKEKLYNYICELFKIEELTPLIDGQLTKITKNNKVTYSGLQYTLYYYFIVKDNKPDLKTGIGIIPYVYEEARGFCLQQKKIEEVAKHFSMEERKEETVYIKPKRKKVVTKIKKLDEL